MCRVKDVIKHIIFGVLSVENELSNKQGSILCMHMCIKFHELGKLKILTYNYIIYILDPKLCYINTLNLKPL